MKKLLIILALALALTCTLTACKLESDENTTKEDVITVEDGYLVVNGVKTEHKVHTEPVISVIDGYVTVNGVKTEYEVNKEDVITVEDSYLVVNGEKTEHKVRTEPVISVIDGYVAVNGEKTEHKVHTEPVVSVIDGYVAVNGVKTEYEVNKADVITVEDGYLIVNGVKTQYSIVAFGCNHIWNTVTTAPTCYSGGYDTMTCPLCDKSVKVNETEPTEHTYATTYTIDNGYHWYKCIACPAAKDKELHSLDDGGVCTVCQLPVSSTPGVVYDVSADGTYAEVIAYNGTATKVKIAEEYQDLPVKVIYEHAFFDIDTITSVVIPDSVTSIGYGAFALCSSLSTVAIPDSVTSIGYNAFLGCHSSLYTEYELGKYMRSGDNPYAVLIEITNKNMSTYTIHEDTKVIGERIFENCSRLTSITIPDSVTSIGHSSFYNCSSLSSVVIGDSVTSIGTYAFNDCTSLSSIVIGDSVTSIGEYAFYSCNALSDVYYTGSEEEWAEISIGSSNYRLTNATKYYNYVPEEN